jgi:hypothetical protein
MILPACVEIKLAAKQARRYATSGPLQQPRCAAAGAPPSADARQESR